MKYLFYALLVLVLAVTLALIAYPDPGAVIITYGNWTLETTVAFMVAALVLTCVAFYAAMRLARLLWTLPRSLRRWRHNRRAAHARQALARGLIALAEGHYERAEHRLGSHAQEGDMPFLQYMAAARAAHALKAHERRDAYLEQAVAALPRAALAVGITQAGYQIESGQLHEAHATVTRLLELKPEHRRVLELAVRVHADIGLWERVLELLPAARKHKAVTEAEAGVYGRRAALARLEAGARDGAALESVWRETDPDCRADAAVVEAYARMLLAREQFAAAEEVVRTALERQWSPALALLYGLVPAPDAAAQLHQAERWLAARDADATLRLTVGRLCLRNQLWGKARAHLEASLAAAPRPEAWRELAALFERLKEPELALQCYRRA